MGLLLGMTLVLGGAFQAQAADLLERVNDQEIKQVLRLRVGHSKVLRTPFAITRISMADPEIADIILISEKEVYVNAQAPGVTNLSLWGKNRFTTAKLVWQPRGYNPDLHKWLHRIDVPSLILWGASDKLFPVPYAHEFNRLIPGSRLAVIPACGHLPNIEKPVEFVDTVGGFAAGA